MTAITLEAINRAKDLKTVLEKQLAFLKEKQKSELKRYMDAPSQNNEFIYVADALGMLQLHQDADFVCEAIITPVNRLNSIARLKVEDLGASRVMSISVLPRTIASPPVMVDGAEMMYAQQTVPGINQGATRSPCRTFDDWFELSVEWLIPRGSAFRFTPEAASNTDNPTIARVILIGYKVY